LKPDAQQIAAAGIVVQKVAGGNLGAEVLAPAVVASQPSGTASLTAHAEGVISRLNKRLGDPVRAGEVLALVDSKDAAQLASDRANADAYQEERPAYRRMICTIGCGVSGPFMACHAGPSEA
jgi:cobalt-zinc-cadmium efflux system membrane fusion protein